MVQGQSAITGNCAPPSRTVEGSIVKRHGLWSRDDLVVCISLTAAAGILVSAVAAMWMWSVFAESRAMVTVERGLNIP